jgi:cytochrome P450
VLVDGENYNGLREPNPHQVFGNGPHHCAGAHLSRRTVGVILLPILFERFPNMTLPDPASVRAPSGFRSGYTGSPCADRIRKQSRGLYWL